MSRRTDTFDPVCFLYAPLSRTYKAIEIYCYSENRKKDTSSDRRLLFSPQIKKPPALRGNIWKFLEFPRNKVLNWTFLSIFLKRNFYFYTLKQQHLFCLILQCWKSAVLLSRTLNCFLQVTLCNQPTVVLRHWRWYRTGTFKPCSTPL